MKIGREFWEELVGGMAGKYEENTLHVGMNFSENYNEYYILKKKFALMVGLRSTGICPPVCVCVCKL